MKIAIHNAQFYFTLSLNTLDNEVDKKISHLCLKIFGLTGNAAAIGPQFPEEAVMDLLFTADTSAVRSLLLRKTEHDQIIKTFVKCDTRKFTSAQVN